MSANNPELNRARAILKRERLKLQRDPHNFALMLSVKSFENLVSKMEAQR